LDIKATDGKRPLEAAFKPIKKSISEVLTEALERIEKDKEMLAG
jgi:hypothetical protein